MIDWAFGRIVGGALDVTVGSGGTGQLFRDSRRTNPPRARAITSLFGARFVSLQSRLC